MAEEGAVICCHTPGQWWQQLELSEQSKKLVVVEFNGSRLRRESSRFFTELARKFPNVIFLKVDVDELKSLTKYYGIGAIPTFIFLKEGNPAKEAIVGKVVGEHKDQLLKKIELHMSA